MDLHSDGTHCELWNRSLMYWEIRSLETLQHTLEILTIRIFITVERFIDEPDLLPFTSEDRAAWGALDELLASKSPLVAEHITVILCPWSKLRLTRAVQDRMEIWWEDLFPQTVDRFNFVGGDGWEEEVEIKGTAK
ncbi:hypothetical protein BDZ89DRAFT_1062404 [Hymenopellis radicata]|nr:hypothetical protein BDZ89DRAFT_1062404 [Hymenopellis radicata]